MILLLITLFFLLVAGEFNTETLENSLVNQILELTKIKDVRLLAAAHSQVEGMTEKGFCVSILSCSKFCYLIALR